jgi:hypothetical protein
MEFTKRIKPWTSQQWEWHLNEAKVTTQVLIEDIRTVLEQRDAAWRRSWDATYQCLGSLRVLESTVRNASVSSGWREDPKKLIELIIKQIQLINDPQLGAFPLQLALLGNDLEELTSYS